MILQGLVRDIRYLAYIFTIKIFLPAMMCCGDALIILSRSSTCYILSGPPELNWDQSWTLKFIKLYINFLLIDSNCNAFVLFLENTFILPFTHITHSLHSLITTNPTVLLLVTLSHLPPVALFILTVVVVVAFTLNCAVYVARFSN